MMNVNKNPQNGSGADDRGARCPRLFFAIFSKMGGTYLYKAKNMHIRERKNKVLAKSGLQKKGGGVQEVVSFKMFQMALLDLSDLLLTISALFQPAYTFVLRICLMSLFPG